LLGSGIDFRTDPSSFDSRKSSEIEATSDQAEYAIPTTQRFHCDSCPATALPKKSKIPPTAVGGSVQVGFYKQILNRTLIPPTVVGGYFNLSDKDLNNPPTAVGGIQGRYVGFG
jgi:hypothetical protein